MFFVAAVFARPHPADAWDCARLMTASLPNTTIVRAASIPAATGAAPLVAYCAVTGYVTTPGVNGEPSNRDGFEVDLPLTQWNGKLFFSGGGGYIGGLHALAPLNQGYVTAYTDTGHTASTDYDATWATNVTKKVDYAYRGIHVGTEAAKDVIRAFYGKAARRAYFVGCSTGGNEAFGEAQRYPNDYDGIIGGDPAIDYSNLVLQLDWNEQHLLASTRTYIPPAKLPAIAGAVLASCSAVDGGLIVDPRTCRFRPSQLRCKGADGPTCLSAAQVETLDKLLQGPVTSDSHRFIFPGDPVGYEDTPANTLDARTWEYGLGIVAPIVEPDGNLTFPGNYFADPNNFPKEYSYVDQYFKYLAYARTNLNNDWRSFDFTTASVAHFNAFGQLHDQVNPNLSAFAAHGGKLISYNGWADHVVSPFQIVGYYETVVDVMGAARTDSFFRLFMVPGMNHCFLGPGPDFFGQPLTTGGPLDPQHNIVSALDAWVERGVPPKAIVATKYLGDDAAQTPLRTYPLCRYPNEARWTGAGNVNDANNYRCVLGPRGNGYGDRY
jgi:hypothetical protein